MKTQNCNEVVVVMVPFPAQGHLNQLLHLSHLISSYGLPVHYTGSSIHLSAFTIFTNIWEKIPEKPFKLDSDFPTCIPSNEGCLIPKVSEFIFNQQKLLGFESGVLCNTSRVIEGKFMECLEKLWINPDAKFFAIGPLNPVKFERKVGTERHKCLKWLDKQEQGTVIYICFRLERSEQKFIWVLRKADRIDFENGDLEGEFCLPEGFEKRVKNRGMVVREWVPQVEILGHSSVGGFMSHCGWNSCMESISMGVPMAAWPMHSDQPRNGVLVTEVLKVGLLVRDWKQRGSLVMATTIENVVKRLMVSEEGMETRKRARELGNSVRASIGSHKEMDCFVSHITR